MQIVKFIEEVENGDPKEITEIYTDEQLYQGGLVKIEAFVRTKVSTAAIRKARQREKQKEEGIKTLTISAPTEAHTFFKTVAKNLHEGKKIEDAIKESVTNHAFVTTENEKTIKIGEAVMRLSGWKKWIVSKLIKIEF